MDYSFLIRYCNIPTDIVGRIRNDNDLLDVMRGEFTVRHIMHFIEFSTLSPKEWAWILSLSTRALQRKLLQQSAVLEFPLAEITVEMGEIYAIGLRAFEEDKTRLMAWLFSPNAYFKEKRPFDVLNSHKGRVMIKDELGRIEHSIFS